MVCGERRKKKKEHSINSLLVVLRHLVRSVLQKNCNPKTPPPPQRPLGVSAVHSGKMQTLGVSAVHSGRLQTLRVTEDSSGKWLVHQDSSTLAEQGLWRSQTTASMVNTMSNSGGEEWEKG